MNTKISLLSHYSPYGKSLSMCIPCWVSTALLTTLSQILGTLSFLIFLHWLGQPVALHLHILRNNETVWLTDCANRDRVYECAWDMTSLKRNLVFDRDNIAVSMCLLTALWLHYDSPVNRAPNYICFCVKAHLTPSSCQSVARHERNTPSDVTVHQSEAQMACDVKQYVTKFCEFHLIIPSGLTRFHGIT